MSSDIGRLRVRHEKIWMRGKGTLLRPAALLGRIPLNYNKGAPGRQEKGNAVDKGAAGGYAGEKQLDF